MTGGSSLLNYIFSRELGYQWTLVEDGTHPMTQKSANGSLRSWVGVLICGSDDTQN